MSTQNWLCQNPTIKRLTTPVFESTFDALLKVDNLTDEHYWIGYTTMNPQKRRSITANFNLKF